MARKQLGAAPSGATDAATKGYVDAEISTIELTPGATGASGATGSTGASGVPGASGGYALASGAVARLVSDGSSWVTL